MEDINKTVINAIAAIAMFGLIGCGDENTADNASGDDPSTSTTEDCYKDADCDGITEYFSEIEGKCEPSHHWPSRGDGRYVCSFREGWDGYIPICYERYQYISDCTLSNTGQPGGNYCRPTYTQVLQTCE